ncbi:MAG: hypothetical protein WBD18_09615, partial [Phycisphaerae bacterium]
MRKLPGNIGKALQEGKLSANQKKLLAELDELEKRLPSTSQEHKEIMARHRKEYDEKKATTDAAERGESSKALAAAGLAEGDEMEMNLPILGGLGGVDRYRGKIKVGKRGTIYVRTKSGETYDLFKNPWRKVEPEATPAAQGVDLFGQPAAKGKAAPAEAGPLEWKQIMMAPSREPRPGEAGFSAPAVPGIFGQETAKVRQPGLWGERGVNAVWRKVDGIEYVQVAGGRAATRADGTGRVIPLNESNTEEMLRADALKAGAEAPRMPQVEKQPPGVQEGAESLKGGGKAAASAPSEAPRRGLLAPTEAEQAVAGPESRRAGIAPSAKAVEGPEFVMSEGLRRLHEHRARAEGLNLARDPVARAYLDELQKAAESGSPAALAKADDAIVAYYRGDFAEATAASETALGYLHEVEMAEYSYQGVEPEFRRMQSALEAGQSISARDYRLLNTYVGDVRSGWSSGSIPSWMDKAMKAEMARRADAAKAVAGPESTKVAPTPVTEKAATPSAPAPQAVP